MEGEHRPWIYRDPGRQWAGAGLAVALWVGAWLCVVVGVVLPLGDRDPLDGRPWYRVGSVGLIVVAALLVLASGPAAYRISGRRAFLLATVVPAVVAATVYAVAASAWLPLGISHSRR